MTTAVLNRTIARVTDKRWLGPDAQVDAKALLIEPGSDPMTTDPFLSLVEDEFSTKGLHPASASRHRDRHIRRRRRARTR